MIITRLLLVVGLIVACTRPSYAQTVAIDGLVVDARTGRPLPGVAVTVDGLPARAETDAEGRFRLEVPRGPHVITASLVGYAVLRQPIDATTTLPASITIRLSEGVGAYEEHVSVSGGGRQHAGTAPAGAELHGRDLQALRGVTLDDPIRALHALPSAAATDDFYSEFAVRGSPFRQVGLTVDGVPSRYLMHSVHGVTDGGSIAMINTDAVGSLALLPGTYPQRTGRHLGAQVDLNLRDGTRDEFRGRAGLNGTSAAVLVEGPLADGRGSWLVSGRRSYLDLLLKRIDEEGSLAFGFTDGQVKVVFDVTPRHQLQALAIGGLSGFSEDPENLGVNDEAEIDGRSWLTGIAWRYTPSARIAVTQRVFTTGLAYDNRNLSGAVLDDARFVDIGWRTDASLAVRSGLLLEIGGDVLRLSGRHAQHRSLNDAPELTLVSEYRQGGHAMSGYAHAIVSAVPRLTLAPGVRVDRWSLSDTSIASPWITADLAVTSATHVRAGTGVFRQFARFDQIYGTRGGGGSLRPERAQHVDVGATQRLPGAASLQVTWYSRDERDVLWTPGAEPRLLADGQIALGRADAPWVNALNGRARGVEVVVRRDAPTGLSGWVGYAYGRHRYTDRSTSESFWADVDQRHGLSVFGQYRLSNRTTFGAKFRFGSNYPLVGFIGTRPFAENAPPLFGGVQPLFYGLTESRNTLRLPAYARLDIRADRTFTWHGRRVTVFGEVANALNRRNVRNVPYGVDRAGRVFGPTDALLPIVPSAGLVFEF